MSLIVSPTRSWMSLALRNSGWAPSWRDAHLERDARARRGLHEDHGHGTSLEQLRRDAGLVVRLELGGQIEQAGDLCRGVMVHGEEARALEAQVAGGELVRPSFTR